MGKTHLIFVSSCAQVKPEELKVFDNVVDIDASINSLSLGDYCIHHADFPSIRSCASCKHVSLRQCVFTGSFSSFVSLRQLNVSLNGISNMTFQAADFPHLEVRDFLLFNRPLLRS